VDKVQKPSNPVRYNCFVIRFAPATKASETGLRVKPKKSTFGKYAVCLSVRFYSPLSTNRSFFFFEKNNGVSIELHVKSGYIPK
jgi:hypothetical protein